jgi:ketosteroid isomerase-like protein
MSQENVELVRALYAEWEKGNFGAMAELYAPDVEWHWSIHAPSLGLVPLSSIGPHT